MDHGLLDFQRLTGGQYSAIVLTVSRRRQDGKKFVVGFAQRFRLRFAEQLLEPVID